jgi:hypothetical protein
MGLCEGETRYIVNCRPFEKGLGIYGSEPCRPIAYLASLVQSKHAVLGSLLGLRIPQTPEVAGLAALGRIEDLE